MNLKKINWLQKDTIFQPENWNWFEMLEDFSIPLGYPHDLVGTDSMFDLKKGDILPICSGEYVLPESSRIYDSLFGCYKGDFQPLFISILFLESNEVKFGGKLFRDITQQVLRDNKLNHILNDR
jgi:hypothetical protein